MGRKVDGVVTQRWLYGNQLEPVAELDASNQIVAGYVYATKPYVPDYMVKSGVTYRIVSDHLGSVRLVVNTSNGAIAQRIDYDEWGNATLVAGTWDVQPFGFAGGLYDPDTGLTRFGFRDYDPVTGRWTAKDPILFGGRQTNLYSYSFNDPINLVDPSGLDALVCGAATETTNASMFGSYGLDDAAATLAGFAGGALIRWAIVGGTVATAPAWALPVGIGLVLGGAGYEIYQWTSGFGAGVEGAEDMRDTYGEDERSRRVEERIRRELQ